MHVEKEKQCASGDFIIDACHARNISDNKLKDKIDEELKDIMIHISERANLGYYTIKYMNAINEQTIDNLRDLGYSVMYYVDEQSLFGHYYIISW